MVFYQLPSGRSVFISTEKLISLTHQDIQDLEASNCGSYCNNPFLKLPSSSEEFKNEIDNEDDEYEDLTPDMLSDGDDEPFIEVDYDNLLDE